MDSKTRRKLTGWFKKHGDVPGNGDIELELIIECAVSDVCRSLAYMMGESDRVNKANFDALERKYEAKIRRLRR